MCTTCKFDTTSSTNHRCEDCIDPLTRDLSQNCICKTGYFETGVN